MASNAYFEGTEYRVIYQEDSKTFLILDEMEHFQNLALGGEDVEQVCFFILFYFLFFVHFI
jgi:hypothetical protein